MTHRTALITAGSIAAVVLAGAIAVGANLGILTVADSSPVGKLSASAQPNAGKVVEIYTGGEVSQTYIIRKAGKVDVAVGKNGVRLVGVHVGRHWKWTLTQTSNKKLLITFRFHSTTYRFSVVAGPRGTIRARVDQPITKVVAAPAAAAPAASAVSWTPAPAAPAVSAPTTTRSAAATPSHSDESDHSGGGQDD